MFCEPSGGTKSTTPTIVSADEFSTEGNHSNVHADGSAMSSKSVGTAGPLIAVNSQLYSSIPRGGELWASTDEQIPEQTSTANIYDLPIDPK